MNCGIIQTHHIPVWVSWVSLCIQIPLWYFAYLYFDSVIPNTYGISRSPCFCIKRKVKIGSTRKSLYTKKHDPKKYNPDDEILVQNLNKKFGDFTAVNNLTISIKKDEVFTFLGHNGAGKTTTI